MGRTLPTFNLALDAMQAEWHEFRRALRREDQGAFDQLFILARKHMAEGSVAVRPVPFDAFLMCILIEQQKEIARLRHQLEASPQP